MRKGWPMLVDLVFAENLVALPYVNTAAKDVRSGQPRCRLGCMPYALSAFQPVSHTGQCACSGASPG